MTTELTPCPNCGEPSNNGRTCRLCESEDAMNKALTKCPAAQDEREAFEAWFDDYHDKACAEFGGIYCTGPKGIAEDAWQARASLPAPQQATPETLTRFCPGCGSVGEVPDSFRDCCPDGAKARLIPTSLAHHCRDLFILALGAAKESATPEPVGEQISRAEAIRLINALIDGDTLPPVSLELLRELTRPAPGVPEEGK